MNTMFQKKAGRRRTWKTPNGVTKTEIDYTQTNRPDIVTDVTVIIQVNIGSDHWLVTNNIKLDVEMERKKYDQEATKSRCHISRIKEDRIPTRIENPIRELDDIDTMSETITDLIQQSSTRVAKAINKTLKSRISSQQEPCWRNDETWWETATIKSK